MWRPSIKRGIIGRQGGRPKGSTAGDAIPQPFGMGDDYGRAKYYSNPQSFPGLNGFDLDKPSYAKRSNYRTPLAGSGAIMSRKGEPFDDAS
jgi:hypothetical protein